MRQVPDTYVQGLKDGADLAFQVKDLIEQGMPYTALQAIDLVIGLMQLSVEIAQPSGHAIKDGSI